jgi:hypothetical protein
MMTTIMMKASSPPPPEPPPLPPPPPKKKKPPPCPPPLLVLLDPLLLREELLLLREEPLLDRLTLLRLPPPGRASTNIGDATQKQITSRSAVLITNRRRCIKTIPPYRVKFYPAYTFTHMHADTHSLTEETRIAYPTFRYFTGGRPRVVSLHSPRYPSFIVYYPHEGGD